MTNTKIKICGLGDIRNALVATDAGVHCIGFIFVPRTRRCLDVEKAKHIIEKYRALRTNQSTQIVGVFADQPIDQVTHIIKYCQLDMVQLCGNEQHEYLRKMPSPVIKQIKIDESRDTSKVIMETLTTVSRINELGHIPLLDKYKSGYMGGTGDKFDWTIATEISSREPIWLSGGITPKNVDEAISTVSPSGIDLSSGVETNGIKDPSKIKSLVESVKMSSKADSTN